MNIYPSYTYLIGWSKDHKFYYGCRWANEVAPNNDLMKSYFTSSKLIKAKILVDGLPDIIEIRKEFHGKDRIKRCRNWEAKLLKRMKVLKNQQLWLNKTDNKSILNDPPLPARRGKDHPMYGRNHSEKSRKQMSEKRKGKPNHNRKGYKFTFEERLYASLVHLGQVVTDEMKVRISNTMKTKVKTSEHIENLKAARKIVIAEGRVAKGWKHSAETIAKLSSSKLGELNPMVIHRGEYGWAYNDDGEIKYKKKDGLPTGYQSGRSPKIKEKIVKTKSLRQSEIL